MAESEKPTPRAATPSNSLGLRSFNATGRDDTTTDIIKTRQDPKRVQRNFALITVVVVAFVVAAFITFQRSGLKLNEIFSDESQNHFGTQKDQQKFED